MRFFIPALIFMCLAVPSIAQKQLVDSVPKFRTAGKSSEKRPIIAQRTAASTGIPKILSRIPSKTYEIMLEVYENDPESLKLRDDIRQFLRNKGYTNIKSNVQSYYGENFKFRECDLAILDDASTFVLFIPPCNKAYKQD
jgi:hypothetical protein